MDDVDVDEVCLDFYLTHKNIVHKGGQGQGKNVAVRCLMSGVVFHSSILNIGLPQYC